jgi:hypothetical protein
MNDRIVKEIRDAKAEIERDFDHDVDKYLRHVYEAQKRHGRKLVRGRPKIVKRGKAV